jgi:hypothetical protein
MGLNGMFARMLSNDADFLPDTAFCEQGRNPVLWLVATDHLFVFEGF